MASGDHLFFTTAQAAYFPTTSPATLDVRNLVPCLDFDDSVTETAYFIGFMPSSYAGTTGITVTLGWAFTSSGTPGTDTCDWEVALAKVGDDTDDIDGAIFAAANSVIATSASADGELDYAQITFTDGADMDSITAGDMFLIQVTRDSTGGTASPGDAELYFVLVEET